MDHLKELYHLRWSQVTGNSILESKIPTMFKSIS